MYTWSVIFGDFNHSRMPKLYGC